MKMNADFIKTDPKKVVNVFHKICRICLALGELNSLLEDETNRKFEDITQIKIGETDRLPTNICGKCLERLNAANQFVEECKVSEQFLIEILENADKAENWDHSYSLPVSKIPVENSPKSNGEFKRIITVLNEPIFQDTGIVKTDKVVTIDDTNNLKTDTTDKLKPAKKSSLPIEFKKEYKCCLCSSVLPTRRQFRLHQETHKPYECKDCAITFSSAQSLKRHLDVIHWKLKNYQCEICGKAYFSSKQLFGHKKQHECKNKSLEEAKSLCSYCGESFQKEFHLKNHLLIHERSLVRKKPRFEPKLCHLCGKNVSFYVFNKHLKSHFVTKQTSYKKCNYCFKLCQSNRFRAHMRQHTGSRPYQCNFCPRSFTCNNVYKTHLILHSGEKQHVCTYCGKQFALKKYLTEHLSIHLENGSYDCSHCGKTFKRRILLNRHVKSHFKDTKLTET